MTRSTANPNHTVLDGDNYLGLPIQVSKGPFACEYLDRLSQTIGFAIGQYPRVFAFRVDLHFPLNHQALGFAYSNEVIDRFFESFKAKIGHNRQMARRENGYAHGTVVRYVWAREFGENGRPHYHLAILLNYDAFCALGKFALGRGNMFNRLIEAWASALRLPVEGMSGSVHIPENACYDIYRDHGESIAAFFYRVSYMCKIATKRFDDGGHGFGASRG